MTREDLSIFLQSALNNKRPVAFHALSGMVVIGGTVAFSALLALYFNIDMFRLREKLPMLAGPDAKTGLIFAALIVSMLLFIARLTQAVIEANVAVEREKWFAERLRKGQISGQGNAVRASNYYGRLSSASMKSASTIVILASNLVAMGIILPHSYFAAVLMLICICSAGLFVAMRLLSSEMSKSSLALIGSVKHMSAWKLNPSISYDNSVNNYYRAYFRRILLGSIFGLTPAAIGIAFCIGLFAAQELGALKLNLGTLFIAFALFQAYLGVIGKFFGTIVHGSAFLPEVKPFLIEGSIHPHYREDTLEEFEDT